MVGAAIALETAMRSQKPESLARYEELRNFTRTPEPPPGATPLSGPLTFTIQKHAARRLHYDLRLEVDGVLVSWPIPQGPSYDPNVRRLAMQTEDHPYAYGTFEGMIPAGEYGGGQVIVWDAGTYTVVDEGSLADFRNRDQAEQAMRQSIRGGHARVFFNGRKLKGRWTLHRTRGEGTKSQSLFIKRRDGLEDPGRDVTFEDRSVFSAAFPQPYEPMLPTLTRDVFQRTDWLYEPKLDGYRVLAFVRDGRVHLRSRGGQAYEDRYPQLVQALSRQPIDAAVVDGEVVALGLTGRHLFNASRIAPRTGIRCCASTLSTCCTWTVAGAPHCRHHRVGVEARRGKVFLDYNMNRRSASLAAVYSPRWRGRACPLR
jgi:bifunctional non-homologous end joining protein LigD